jgi:hypothetical protein
MPLLLLIGLLGVGGTAAGVAVENLTEKKSVEPAGINSPSIPWYVTAGLVVVGGVLIYKYGAKILKI